MPKDNGVGGRDKSKRAKKTFFERKQNGSGILMFQSTI